MAGYYDRDKRPFDPGDGTDVYVAGSMNHPMSHHGNVAEYQGSGFPWVYDKGSAPADDRIEFPFVTQWICVTSITQPVFISFKASQSDEAGDAMRFQIPAGTMMPFRIKCVDMWITSAGLDVTVMAGLTNVPRSEFPSIVALEGVNHVYTGAANGSSAKTTPG